MIKHFNFQVSWIIIKLAGITNHQISYANIALNIFKGTVSQFENHLSVWTEKNTRFEIFSITFIRLKWGCVFPMVSVFTCTNRAKWPPSRRNPLYHFSQSFWNKAVTIILNGINNNTPSWFKMFLRSNNTLRPRKSYQKSLMTKYPITLMTKMKPTLKNFFNQMKVMLPPYETDSSLLKVINENRKEIRKLVTFCVICCPSRLLSIASIHFTKCCFDLKTGSWSIMTGNS